MSPRRRDPATRAELIEISARLLAEEGSEAMSSRRIAKEAGTSTMAVYTHFGSMSGLVREMVHEGFGRLAAAFDRITWSDDPVRDLAVIGRVYRRTAVSNAHLYSVMFGDRAIAGFELSEEDRQYGRFNLLPVVECAARCVEAGRFRGEDAMLVAHHMWLAMHGGVTLELNGYLIDPCDADRCFESQTVTLMVGAGDTLEAAQASVLASAEAFARDFGDGVGEGASAAEPEAAGDGLDGGGGRRERTPSKSG
ncbi:TetR/AcrR family transcriptional regulator [Actinophytocola glycyrrhizae]|uniref:TetR/AcrR family transcriptional regulator n=1 Tax=Actinophytocola glycyrrhizae TaxID=2044873 RepID=A0ABV9S5L1_9PSEU